MNDEDRVLLRVVADGLRTVMRHVLLLEKGTLRTANLTGADLDVCHQRIHAALGDPTTGLGDLTGLLDDLHHARVAGAQLRR